jgi:hypothetical protein
VQILSLDSFVRTFRLFTFSLYFIQVREHAMSEAELEAGAKSLRSELGDALAIAAQLEATATAAEERLVHSTSVAEDLLAQNTLQQRHLEKCNSIMLGLQRASAAAGVEGASSK